MTACLKQVWRPLGRVVEPVSNGGWWASHASYPTAMSNDDGSLSIYFSVRDATNRSSLACIGLTLDGERWETLGPVRGPLLGPGPRGGFDADGVTATSFLRHEGRVYAYYLGWTIGVSVPFTNTIGIAERQPDGTFERLGPAPIIGRSRENPFTLGYPWVLLTQRGFEMWFGTHLFWGAEGLQMSHVIKQALSANALDWVPQDRVVVPLAGASDPHEFALSRPVVVAEPNGTHSMWYARRRPRYSIGYAMSADQGVSWERHDELFTMDGMPEPWEAEERTYPCVFDHGGSRYMLYNGNGYGLAGFGLARLET